MPRFPSPTDLQRQARSPSRFGPRVEELRNRPAPRVGPPPFPAIDPEFAAVQNRIADACARDDEPAPADWQAERRWLTANTPIWEAVLREWNARDLVFRRGRLSRASLTGRAFLSLPALPLEGVRLIAIQWLADDWPTHRLPRRLDLSGNRLGRGRVERMIHGQPFHTLDMSGNDLRDLPMLPDSLISLNLANNGLTSLGRLPDLDSLDVSGNRLGNGDAFPASLVRLAIAETHRTQLPNLAGLRHFDGSFNAFESLQALEGTRLTRVSLRGCRLRPEQARGCRLPALRRLDLSVNFLGDQVVHLIDFTRLARLQLMNALVTHRGVAMLVDRRPGHLTHLDLSWNPIGDDAVPLLLSLPNLFELNVSGTKLSRRGVRRLSEAIPIVVS